jgi:isopenicillin N synthase-like dioxygenase
MKVLTIDFEAPNAAKLFAKSLRETGFAVLKNHPVEEALLKAVYNEWDDFFNNINKHLYVNKNANEFCQNGYYPANTETAKGSHQADLKEFYQFYPQYKLPVEISDLSRCLFDKSFFVAQTLLEWIEKETPSKQFKYLNEPLKNIIEGSQNTLLRVINYPPLSGEEEKGAVRAAAHGDINLLTILPASTQPGLQVMDIEGKWINIECDPNTLIVNIGDMLSKASDGYYPSTIHRVINPTDESAMKKNRMSMPLFLHARPDVRITKDLVVGEYLEKRLIEIGIKKK